MKSSDKYATYVTYAGKGLFELSKFLNVVLSHKEINRLDVDNAYDKAYLIDMLKYNSVSDNRKYLKDIKESYLILDDWVKKYRYVDMHSIPNHILLNLRMVQRLLDNIKAIAFMSPNMIRETKGTSWLDLMNI